MKKKIIKVLGIGLLTLALGVNVACKKPSSSSQMENPSSSEVISSEPTGSSEESSSSQVSEEVSSSSPSSSSPSSSEKEEPEVETTYKIVMGETEIVLTKEAVPAEGFVEQYTTTLASVTKNTEIKFFKNKREISPSCASLGNNIILTTDFKTKIHNDATNVKLYLNFTADGFEAWLDGYAIQEISVFTAKANNEDITITEQTPSSGMKAKFKVTLAINDVLVVYGDGSELYIGGNAMHYETEYKAPLPGEYIIEVNEYNRLVITEPVLEVEELYLAYVNNEQITANFVTPNNPEDKAQFTVELKKGDEFAIKYVDGTMLEGGVAIVDCTYTIYINKDGQCFKSMTSVSLDIKCKVNGEEITLTPRAAGDNLAVYRITVEEGDVVAFLNGTDELKYRDSSETSFTVVEAGTYTIYINQNLQVWDEKYVEATYTELKVTGVNSKLLEDRNIYVWAWETNKDGAWSDELGKVNEDGSITIYVPEICDNFLFITTFKDRPADWNNVKSQTNDVKIEEGKTSYTVTWKAQENVGGSGSTTPATSLYGLRGTYDGGDWGTTLFMTQVTSDVYAVNITVTESAEFKVVKVKEDDATFIEIWFGQNNTTVEAGTYQVTFTVSTSTLTVTKA